MVRRTLLLAAAAAALAALLPAPPATRAQGEKGEAVELFNGKNLDGWKVFLDPKAKDVRPDEVFTVKDGVIRCTGKPNGYLLTEKDYGDYVLTLEWRWPEREGNS